MAGSIKLSVVSTSILSARWQSRARRLLGTCSNDDVDAIERALVEAVNNVIKHGYANDY